MWYNFAMHRLLVPEELMSGEAIALPDDAARHLKVVRPRAGEEVELFDGHGRTRRCRWDGRRLVADGPATTFPAPQTELVLFACVTKGSRWGGSPPTRRARATPCGCRRSSPPSTSRRPSTW